MEMYQYQGTLEYVREVKARRKAEAMGRRVLGPTLATLAATYEQRHGITGPQDARDAAANDGEESWPS